jgi:hypothetical protein
MLRILRSLGRRVSECWSCAASVMRRLSLNHSEPAKKRAKISRKIVVGQQ